MKILLVEDNATTGDAIRSALVSRGHEVIWILGAELPDVTETAIAPDGKRTKVNLEGVQLALIDSYLGELSFDGTAIGQRLMARGNIGCIGIGSAQGNRTMKIAGAVHISCTKDEGEDVTALVDAVVSFGEAFDTTETADGPNLGPRAIEVRGGKGGMARR
jgi:hypothetical protein